jgi:hypothetical protein
VEEEVKEGREVKEVKEVKNWAAANGRGTPEGRWRRSRSLVIGRNSRRAIPWHRRDDEKRSELSEWRNCLAEATPRFFVSVPDKGVTGAKSVSVASKGVAGGQFRPKHGKTRRSAVSVASKGLRAGAKQRCNEVRKY